VRKPIIYESRIIGENPLDKCKPRHLRRTTPFANHGLCEEPQLMRANIEENNQDDREPYTPEEPERMRAILIEKTHDAWAIPG